MFRADTAADVWSCTFLCIAYFPRSICVLQLEELQKLHAKAVDASKDLLASIFWQEVHLEQVILDLVRESCADVLAPNAHMTVELTNIVNALAADKVPSPSFQ